MSLVIVEGLGLSFGGRAIFEDLNLRIGEEDRIGLIGRNGSGKSSLLRIFGGVQEADSGTVRAARSTRIGYLPQEITVEGGRSLLDAVLASVPGRVELEEQLLVEEAELDATDDPAEQMAIAEKLSTIHEDLLHFDTNWSPHEAHAILAGLGFTTADAARDLAEFSGGWKMRAVLAGLLFQKPDLLMLDEPTNHLDLATVGWLADFLRTYPNALLLICHDRDFLNEQVNRIVSYEPEGVRLYHGNYEDYLRQRAEEREILERRATNLSRERDQAERFIRRFRAQATKSKAVQSRVKALEKLDDVELLGEHRGLSFRFPPCDRSGVDSISLHGLGHAYGDKAVFTGTDLTVHRGDKLAIIGPNGAGKTTLLKIVAGELAASEGSFGLGHNVKVGYYAQHVAEKLDVRRTVFEEVWANSIVDDITRVRTILGTFLFSNDDVDKKIGVLSGGEKARVALASLMVNPGNLLLMDEPTNHLDLESAEALAQALETFDGTLVFVSHNRSFVRHLATRIWHVHDQDIEEFPGSFDEFLYHLKTREGQDADPDGLDARPGKRRGERRDREPAKAPVEAPTHGGGDNKGTKSVATGATSSEGRKERSKASTKHASVAAKPAAAVSPAKPPMSKDERQREREETKQRKRQADKLAREVKELEEGIAKLEVLQAERASALALPETFQDQGRYNKLLASYTADASKLEELMARWEQAQKEAEAANQ
ncbi:MAG: ATP-binding cassette subfamily F protein 3 [Hyphomicrobiaceae bacterium]|jgi:ATP-binding cassette subfamily F protein 3